VRTDRLHRQYGVELRWTVFPLHPDTPEEGLELSALYPGRDAEIDAVRSRLSSLAAEEGLPMGRRTRTYNSRRAQELGKWAEAEGAGDSFRRAVYRSLFAYGTNIALADELVRIAASVGLPSGEGEAVLSGGRFAAAVDADWRRATALGVDAVPTHICGERRLVGFGAYERFEQLIGKG
jgi:predicted DsbA family dithiol-disulfide isomerase